MKILITELFEGTVKSDTSQVPLPLEASGPGCLGAAVLSQVSHISSNCSCIC